MPRQSASRRLADRDRRTDYRSALVWPAVLWSDQTNRRFRQRRSRRLKKEAQAGTASCRKERVRCAIYTRKSSDEGLEQRSSIRCRRIARPASQGHEGWVCLSQGYNDGGFAGATTDRPALQRLLADITAGRAPAIRSAAASPTSSPAVRYWNRARQRYHRLSTRYSRARVSLPTQATTDRPALQRLLADITAARAPAIRSAASS